MEFQSLLHQGISLLEEEGLLIEEAFPLRFNPFFIRASVYCDLAHSFGSAKEAKFQSLLHQGISLLIDRPQHPNPVKAEKVSIPSSSGHQFTVYRSMPRSTRPRRRVSIPSSSGHQFTALA